MDEQVRRLVAIKDELKITSIHQTIADWQMQWTEKRKQAQTIINQVVAELEMSDAHIQTLKQDIAILQARERSLQTEILALKQTLSTIDNSLTDIRLFLDNKK